MITRRDFLCNISITGSAAFISTASIADAVSKNFASRQNRLKKPNIVFISADDMSYSSLGCTGCSIPDISPNLDRLASEGLLLDHCHIITPICGPSRRAWITGAYPHQTGHMGHYKMPPQWFKKPHIDTNAAKILRDEAGYYTGVMCKFPEGKGWNWQKNHREMGLGRDPRKFYESTKEFIAKALDAGKPFFLHANSMDPHEYWARQTHETKEWITAMMGEGNKYNRYPNGKPYPDPDVDYKPNDIDVPPCWPDNKDIREEIHTYYNSVKRLDDTVGEILKAIKESGQEENTMVLFVSDHGIGKAFGKWSLYPLGTRTPLIVRWPSVTAAGRHDRKNIVSTIDFAPTFLEMAGLEPRDYMHGLSLVSLFKDSGVYLQRKSVFTCFNYMNNYPGIDESVTEFDSGNMADIHNNYRPMRAINTTRYTYIWNSWSDGKREIPLEMSGGQAVRRILYETGHASRADFEKYREKEEFYDTIADPGCLHNLINQPHQQERISYFRNELLDVMIDTQDHELNNYKSFRRNIV
jgi:N-sulfoglucosamine sulfohydrolase